MSKNLVLVDSSVWIQALRKGHSSSREHLDYLLAEDRVAICGPIKAELLSGATSLEDYKKLSKWLAGLYYISMSDEKVWDHVAEARFKLAKKGIQQRLIDLFIAWIAHKNNIQVWSLDGDFERISDVISFKIYNPDI